LLAGLSLVRNLARYWLAILPNARRELRRWEREAQRVSDPDLRMHALKTLRDEAFNAEAAAVFATLAGRRYGARVVRLVVAWQVMFDYLDTVGEHSPGDILRDNRRLHLALSDALQPVGETLEADYYRFHCQGYDDGYLDTLVDTCRSTFHELPGVEVIGPTALRAARRCAEGQSRTHAASRQPDESLATWAAAQAPLTPELAWWELAAGAISSLSLHALVAAASHPGVTHEDADRIDSAYYPTVCALSTLLDSLMDRAEDNASGTPGYIAYYPNAAEAAQRLAKITHHAALAVRELPHGRRHSIILTGVAAYYLTTAAANSSFAREATFRIFDSLDEFAPLVVASLRLRRRITGRTATGFS
jgi:tetraprenyl-beta-curcumene synthase